MFDRILMLDWSAAAGPRRGADSIWLGDGVEHPVNLPTRTAAETALAAALAAPGRVLLGVDIGFGWPSGLARTVTGQASALAMWDWLADRVQDNTQSVSNYRAVAAQANGCFHGGAGPFWGDGTRAGTPGLPRLKPALPPGLAPLRQTETHAAATGPKPKSMFQLAGAGAVGAQSLTCLPVLARLARQLGPQAAIWPFQPIANARVVFTEVYFSMLGPVGAGYACRDAAQVDLMARTVRRIGAATLLQMPNTPDTLAEEGWIMGCDAARQISAQSQI